MVSKFTLFLMMIFLQYCNNSEIESDFLTLIPDGYYYFIETYYENSEFRLLFSYSKNSVVHNIVYDEKNNEIKTNKINPYTYNSKGNLKKLINRNEFIYVTKNSILFNFESDYHEINDYQISVYLSDVACLLDDSFVIVHSVKKKLIVENYDSSYNLIDKFDLSEKISFSTFKLIGISTNKYLLITNYKNKKEIIYCIETPSNNIISNETLSFNNIIWESLDYLRKDSIEEILVCFGYSNKRIECGNLTYNNNIDLISISNLKDMFLECDLNINNYKLNKLHSSSNYWDFGIICSNKNKFVFSIFSGQTLEIKSKYKNFYMNFNDKEYSNPNLVYFPLIDYGIYFKENNDIKFSFIEKAICKNFQMSNIPINKEFYLYFQSYIFQPIIPIENLEFRIITTIPNTIKIYSSQFEYESFSLINVEQRVTIYSSQTGNFTMNYNTEGNNNKICQINYEFISECPNDICNECDSNFKCIECNYLNGYYKYLENNKVICLTKNEIQDNFYIEDYIIEECDKSCSQCDNKNSCIYCNQNEDDENKKYYFTEDQICLTKQYALNNGYYFNETTETFSYCIDGCRTCNGKGSENNMNCAIYSSSEKQCLDNYYKVSNFPSECWSLEKIKNDDNYVFNEEKQLIEYCDSSCIGCKDNKYKCIDCRVNYYKIDKYYDINSECYDTPPLNYYLDRYYYSLCYESCSSCLTKGNNFDNKCIKCKEGYQKNKLKETNCNRICENYWYYNNNNIICTNHCPNDKPLLIENQQCVSDCNNYINNSNIILYQFNNECVKECPFGYSKNEKNHKCENIKDECYYEKYQSEIPLKSLSNEINGLVLNYSKYYNERENIVVYMENIKEQYTTLIYKSNVCVSFLNHLSKLDLLNCPKKLREYYNLPSNSPLIILKTDVTSNPNSDSIGYSIYSNNGERLDSSICQNEKIQITIPINEINAGNINLAKFFSDNGIDIYNINDAFFNDICLRFTSENGKDVPLNERKRYFQNISVCQNDCSYKEINFTSMEAVCDCNIKTNFVIEILNNSLTNDIVDLVSTANFELFKCYKNVFNKRELKNIGGWIIFVFIVIQIIFTFLYYKNGIDKLYKYLSQYIYSAEPCPPRKRNLKFNDYINDRIEEAEENNNNERLNSNYNHKESISRMKSTENYNQSTKMKTSSKYKNKNSRNLSNLKNISSPKFDFFNNLMDNNEYLRNAKIISIFNLTSSKKKRRALENKETPKKKRINLITKEKTINNVTNSNNESSSKNMKSFSSSKTLMANSFLNTQKSKNESFDSSISSSSSNNSNSDNSNINDINNINKTDNNNNDNNKNSNNIERQRDSIIRRRGGISDMREIQERRVSIKEEIFEENELNEMSVEDAIKYDKRNFCIFYWGLLKKHQDIINLFFNINPLQSFHIKIISYIFEVSFYFFITALFFDESYISSEIHSKGKSFKLITLIQNEIGRCIYSSIVNVLGGMLSKCIAVYTKRLEFLIKAEKNKDKFIRQSNSILCSMKHLNVFFLVINFILILTFWYYISAFCDVMYNTRINWIEGTTITFFIMNTLPFISCFIITFFRYLGKGRYFGFLYKLSQWIM